MVFKKTGIRRRGTTYSELQTIFINNITTKFIYEPLACCNLNDLTEEVLFTLNRLDFDILGVIDNDRKIGYVRRQDLEKEPIKNYLHQFEKDQIIPDSTPLTDLFEILNKDGFVFISSENEVEGIVTKADINKPIVRIYLFGIISLFEIHLNFWIAELNERDSWLDKLNNDRIQMAKNLFNERKGNNIELTLLECLQISDKKQILKKTDEFLAKFNYSKGKLKGLLEHVGVMRNEIAHSQNSIISNLSWSDFIECILEMEDFLEKSEKEIVK